MGRIYLDSCIVIYLVEGTEEVRSILENRLNDPVLGDTEIVVSDLVRLETLVIPRRSGDTDLLDLFESFFLDPSVEIPEPTRTVFERATEIRARHLVPTPDALHLAFAIEGNCDEFWTNDRRLEKAADDLLRVILPVRSSG